MPLDTECIYTLIQDLKQQSYKIGRVVFLVRSGIETLLDNFYNQYTKKNKEALLGLLLEHTHEAFVQARMIKAISPLTAEVSSDKKRTTQDETDENHHSDASECAVQQLERIVGYTGAIEACSQQMVRVRIDAQNLVKHMQECTQQLDSLAAKYAEHRDHMKECLDFETRMAALNEVKLKNAKAMLEIEKERAALQCSSLVLTS